MKLPTSYPIRVGDAVSQLGWVAIFNGKNPNTSISGASYRYNLWTRRPIDFVFFWDKGPNGEGHCQLADMRDIQRAIDLLTANGYTVTKEEANDVQH
jgi:hypothetical protein